MVKQKRTLLKSIFGKNSMLSNQLKVLYSTLMGILINLHSELHNWILILVANWQQLLDREAKAKKSDEDYVEEKEES